MINAYFRLMRLDKPIGIFLLWYPTAWALWAANQGMPPLNIMFLFALGTLVMRSAGCIINDIADRDFDKFVKRTNKRPLTTGELSVKSALLLTGILLAIALMILLNLPVNCAKYAVIAVALTVIYPLCKRFFNAPQFILGFAFSMGIPMAYAASAIAMSSNGMLLFLINMLWIIVYDTLYAMADKKEDLLIGIKSTAIYFGIYDRLITSLLAVSMHILWILWAYNSQVSGLFYLFWIFAALVLFGQQVILNNQTPENCIRAFLANNYYGVLMWAAIVFGFMNLK